MLAAACDRGKPPPEPLRPGEDACAQCRMAVSDPRFASQIVRRGAQAEFFDDHGCLRRRLGERPLEKGAAAYVADFETGRWIDASAATFLRAPGAPTPMSSGLMAFETREAAERAATKYQGIVFGYAELLHDPLSTRGQAHAP